jgi:hypothetical protein
MKGQLFIFLFLACVTQAAAQRGIRQRSPVYTPGTAYRNTGWFVGPGLTYMLPEQRSQSLTMYYNDNEGGDTLFNGDYKRSGKIGAYIEAGRHHFIDHRMLLHHVDYGVHGKLLRGREQFVGTTGNSPAIVESNSKYGDLFVGAFANASNIITLSDGHYLMNGLGVNADFKVLSRVAEGASYGAGYQYPSFFTAQLHYKLSYIWRPESGIYVIPSIETPLLTAYPWDGPKATLHYFTDRSRPFIICLRIQWLSKQEDRACEGQPGKGPSLDQGGRRSKNDLFGDQAKSMKKSKLKANKRLERSQEKGKRKNKGKED